ncbi:hypothetical protein C8J57DRAFT_1303243 [Mycena rebaudengoi]|nr:hypothetical protein C8J57DRAFT_1303243 [Mycena rebaudengoi]
MCSGRLNSPGGCIDIPINSDDCRSFTGGLSFLNNEVSSAQIPPGFVCTLYDAVGCVSTTDSDVVFLIGGAWDFLSVPGLAGDVNFDDRTGSFACSPLS